MRSLLAYSQDTTIEEKLTLRIRADGSGDIYLPTAWYSADWLQGCNYDWKVSIDGNEEVVYTGIGASDGKIRVGYGLVPLSVHTVIVKPNDEEYGWLKAFWYKGTNISGSLINIISDKSYKGYAVSENNTGDYFKAYQYYGCDNLINTDEELLPDTLEVIGDYYRYYEYAGCVRLVSNAEEKILKTVKVIWDKYRAYQYQNCEGINKINMRAINWASVGNDYRKNQFDNMGSDRNPMDVYIEGWIEEGGVWWLVNSRVKNVYVYEGLVGDYQTKLWDITSSKIKKNPDRDSMEYEFIEYIALADSSWKIRIPVGWFSEEMSQDCDYDWYVSIDGWEPEEISWTWSATYVSVGSSLVEGSEHRVIIKPATISWWWGRAFGFHTTWAQTYIKELIHDSYKCFATSRLGTGDYYKYWTFLGCTNLINSYEKLPTSVTSIWDYYMKNCYGGCTWLKSAFWEVLHKWCTVGEDYRYQEYIGCTALEMHQWIAWYTGATYPTNYKYQYLSGAWNDLVVYITREEKLASGLTDSMGLDDANIEKIYCYVNDIMDYISSSYWTEVADEDLWGAYYYPYVCRRAIDINRYTKLVNSVSITTRYYADWGGKDWKITGQIAVDKRPWFSKIYLNGQGDTGSASYTEIYEYDLATIGDITTIPKSKWSSIVFSRSWSWSGGNDPSVVQAVDRWGNLYWLNSRNGSSYDYNAYTFNGVNVSTQGSGMPKWFGVAVSKTGKFVFGYYLGGYKRFIANTTPWTSFSVLDTVSTMPKGSLMFSDDGLTMYRGWDNGLEQYTLATPWNMNSAVDTGIRLDVGGYYDMSGDGKYLFRYSGGTIYQYTYE